ncbi:hypothetical protein PCANC_12865 [Puccinia coronata f. sp. avenae]|uniref:Uncharacterized protein n=1 Tax=Puccinia coronata f. sp. avenae TaxID=200324 RepID=A0A2N5SPP8_9BASI|nr:hypothetical protein PCANC_12865 [Puccinia coronata f. sp. avenae]
MKSLVILLAFLSVKTFMCMEKEGFFSTIRGFLLGGQKGYERPGDQMRMKYANAEHRLIVIGEDDGTLKPFDQNNSNEELNRLNKALACLAADTKNEIWITTVDGVKTIEARYGHIPHVNLAGYMGSEFSEGNTASVELPDAGLMKEIEAKASKILNALGITPQGHEDYPRQNYFVRFLFSMEENGQSNGPKVESMALELEDYFRKNVRYKDYSVVSFSVGTEKDYTYVVEIENQYYHNKGVLAQSLFRKDKNRSIGFAISIGNHPPRYYLSADDRIHQVMNSRNHYSILVKKTETSYDQEPYHSSASLRVEDHRQVISLLEEMAEIGDQNPTFDHLGNNINQDMAEDKKNR